NGLPVWSPSDTPGRLFDKASSRLVACPWSKSVDVITWVFDGTLSRSIAAGSGRAATGAGCCGCGCCGAAVVLVAGARRGGAVRAGIGVVEITSTVGSATGGWAGACARAAPPTPIVAAAATTADRNRPLV